MKFYPHRPFDPGRSSMDSFYWRRGDFSFLKGLSSSSGNRYWGIAIPAWLPIPISLIALIAEIILSN